MLDRNTNILIVDDMMTMRKIVRKALTELGFKNVTEADNGLSAWDRLQAGLTSTPIQLIISDWNMPGMNGVELLAKVRKHAQLSNLTFVLLTAESDKEQVKQAATLGVSGYIVKPFSAPELGQKLDALAKALQSKAVA